jgi:glycosyltransferase involved in cell wall biosynthesis
MAIGGVEVGIERSHAALNEVMDYRVFYVKKPGEIRCGQRHVLRLLADTITGAWRPDVVVTSLWPSHPFGWLFRRLGRGWIAFFHNSGFTGRLQEAILRHAWRAADSRLADSEATASVFCATHDAAYRIVPYIFPEETQDSDWLSREIDVVWLGRPVAAKRLDLVVEFLSRLVRRQERGRIALVVAGDVPDEIRAFDPDSGWSVDIHESLDNASARGLLRDSRFYLLTSDYEGMSMSTIEAVFAGCVPIVRPVGELRHYIGCDYELSLGDGGAADLDAVAQRVSGRWSDEAFARLTQAGIRKRIADYSTYVDEFSAAVTSSLG